MIKPFEAILEKGQNPFKTCDGINMEPEVFKTSHVANRGKEVFHLVVFRWKMLKTIIAFRVTGLKIGVRKWSWNVTGVCILKIKSKRSIVGLGDGEHMNHFWNKANYSERLK